MKLKGGRKVKNAEKLFTKVNEDQELAKRLFECESAEEVKGLAAEVDIELTDAEVKEMGKDIVDALKNESGDGELSEDDLDNVAGGAVVATTLAVVSTYVAVNNEVEEETGKDIHDHAIDKVSGWF